MNTHICVGGPMNGQWKAHQGERFRVETLQRSVEYKTPDGHDRVIPLARPEFRAGEYVLRDHYEHGKAWRWEG